MVTVQDLGAAVLVDVFHKLLECARSDTADNLGGLWSTCKVDDHFQDAGFFSSTAQYVEASPKLGNGDSVT